MAGLQRPDDSAHDADLVKVVNGVDAEDPSVRSIGGANRTGRGNDGDSSGKSGMAYSDSGDSMRSYRTDIGKGTWYYAGYHMATTIATPAAYAPLPAAFAALTWSGGLISLVAGIIVTYYCSICLASLSEWNGIRYFRYRDLTNSILGRKGFWATIFFQQVASIGNNITIQIVAGISAKSIYKLYNPTGDLTLQEFIIFFGIVEICLSQLPDLHSLRFINVIATFSTVAFAAIAVGMSIHNGHLADRSTVSYALAGTSTGKIMGIFSALGTIAFAFGDTILPEIQATVAQPSALNMYKGATLCYSVIGSTYLATAIAGYWAFGNTVNPFVINSLSSPTWPITMANVFAIIQVLGCYQIYARPTYEVFENWSIDPNKTKFSARNASARFLVTTAYCVIITTIAAMIPFFGDFVALCGSFGFTPMDFILPLIMYNRVRKPPMWHYLINMTIIVVYSIVALIGSIGAIRFIVLDSTTYSVFNNLPVTVPVNGVPTPL